MGKPNARVWNVSFSPNSKRLIASAGNVIIWDVATGKRILTLDHPQVCLGAAFSPDGKWIATLPFEGRIIKLWDSKTGKLLRTFASSQNELWGVAFSPNGKQLASAARDKTIPVWNPYTAEVLHKLTGPEEFWSVTYSPDGKRLAGSMSRHFSVWDSATGKLIFTIEGHADRIFNLVYRPDGKHLITGSDDKTIKIWDADTCRNLAVLHGHAKRIHKVAIHPDGLKVASVSSDGTVIIWDVSCPH